MVYIFLADGFEEMEALAPLDLLRRAGIEVATVGISGKTVTGSHQVKIEADLLPEELPPEDPEMLILPGGAGHTLLAASPFVKENVLRAFDKGIPLAAICAAPSILGQWGLLKGKRAVCFPGFESALEGATVLTEPVVTDGTITTSRGAGCALHFGLELIRVLRNEALSKEIGESIQL